MLRNHTPYICILIFFGINLGIYSQEKKTLVIQGSNPSSDLIIQKIGYNKGINNDSLYEKEINAFRDNLEHLGFIQNEIDSVYENDSIYYIKLKLNKPINNIKFQHPSMFKIAENLGYSLLDSTTVELAFHETPIFIDGILNYYQDNGHPFVQVIISELKKKEDDLLVDLSIHTNEKRKIDKIIVKGYSNFPMSFLKHSYGLSLDQTFDKNKISSISDITQTIGFVSEIKKPEVLFTKDSTALFLYLNREKSNYFDGILGFSTSPETNKIQLYGNVDVKIQNAINRGETLQLNWLSSQNQSQRLKLHLEAPYIFNTALIMGYDFSIHKQDSTFITTGNLFKSDYQLNIKNKVGFFIESKKSNTLSTQTPLNSSNFSSLFYGASYTYSKPNFHPIFNKKIHLISIVSQGKRDEIQQHKISNFFQFLIPIDAKQNLLLKNTTEILISETYLENELYLLGGSSSIRGFDENIFFADSYSYINTEYNYLLGKSSYLSALTDVGFLRNKIASSMTTTYSFGLGFTQKTKIGLLGIQYFIGNSFNKPFNLGNSKLHIKLTQPF